MRRPRITETIARCEATGAERAGHPSKIAKGVTLLAPRGGNPQRSSAANAARGSLATSTAGLR